MLWVLNPLVIDRCLTSRVLPSACTIEKKFNGPHRRAASRNFAPHPVVKTCGLLKQVSLLVNIPCWYIG